MIIDCKPVDDDFEVFWDGLPVGRILRQPGTPIGKPDVWWGVSFGGHPQPAGHRGIVVTIEEAKAMFKLTWSAVRPTITEQDIARERRRLSQPPVKKIWR